MMMPFRQSTKYKRQQELTIESRTWVAHLSKQLHCFTRASIDFTFRPLASRCKVGSIENTLRAEDIATEKKCS
jgi:hypothetical protein